MAKWGTVYGSTTKSTTNRPNKEGRYIVTIETYSFGRQVRLADREQNMNGEWTWNILPDGCNCVVVAWQKCPDVYEGEVTE